MITVEQVLHNLHMQLHPRGECKQRFCSHRGQAAKLAPLVHDMLTETAKDTRERMVAAAARAVEREDCESVADKARREYAASDERHLNSCIWIDPGRQSGVACFGGTRIPVDPFMAIVEEAGVEAAKALWPSVTDAHVAAGKLWRERYHEWLRGAR